MKRFFITFVFLGFVLFVSCRKNEENVSGTVEINSFVWKAMNSYYLWQDSVSVLADDRFATQSQLNDYVAGYSDSEAFFETLIYKRDVVDKWSWIVDDYVALEEYFQGMRKTTGAVLKLYYTDASKNNVFGIVRYIVPNTDAAGKDIKRGDVFNAVNGVTLNVNNYYNLLYGSNTITLNLGTYSYDSANLAHIITPTGDNVSLTYGEYSENPVYKYSIEIVNGNKVGYLMYNSFVSQYDEDLNNAFAYFKSEGVSDLILDLRYNSGGSVQTSIYLSSMITGQFTGQVFTHEEWNSKWQTWLEKNHPDWLVNYFVNSMTNGTPLNCLNLNRVFVLTTGDSASASELVINALNPYIDVITVGSTTRGKYVASVTLYDSDDFSKNNVNPDHYWAIQPIVLKEVNLLGDYAPQGFSPDVEFYENFSSYGELGTSTDLLYNAAIDYIESGKRVFDVQRKTYFPIDEIFSGKNEMYIEKKLPLNF